MIWTLVVFGISMYVLGKVAFPRIAEALDKRQQAIEESIDTAERTRGRGRASCSPSTASGSRRRASRPTRSSPARARPAEDARGARRSRTRQAQARGDDGADAPRHRGRDAPRDPGDPHRGRRPDGAGDREGHAQDARPTTTSGGSSRRRSPSSTSPPWPATERQLDRWRRSPRSTRARCSRSPRSRASSTTSASSSAQFADALDDDRELQVFFFSPYFSTAGEEGRARQGRRRTPTPVVLNFLELLIEKHRMPAIFRIRRALRRAVGAREQAAAGRDHLGGRARRGDRRADRRPHRRADRPQGRAVRATSTPTSSAASSCGSATRSSTPRSATASNNCASRSSAKAA